MVTDLGEDEIILGYPWLAVFQPDIDWKALVLAEELQPLVIKTLGLNIEAKVERVTKAWIKKARSMAIPGEEVFVTRLDTETLRKTSMAAQMAANAKPKEEKTWDQIIPRHYHQWKKVFSEEAKRISEHQPWDIAINFTADAPKSLDCKIFFFFFWNPLECALGCMTLCGTYTRWVYLSSLPTHTELLLTFDTSPCLSAASRLYKCRG